MTTQIWQHTSGERYIVDVDEAGVVGAAEGPLYHEWINEYINAAENGEDFLIFDNAEASEELANDINERTDEYHVVYPYISG